MVALVFCVAGLLGRPGSRLHRPRGAFIFLGAGREQELRGSGRWEDSGGLHHGHAKSLIANIDTEILSKSPYLSSQECRTSIDMSGND